MGQRIREYDWSQTPLGPVEHWPQSLRTCIRIMLVSRQPIWIGWGKELIKFYNDPYRAIVGGKHPRALGQPARIVWKDIWRNIEPMLKTVMEKNEGTYVESELLIMERNGYPEETYYTFSYTPIPGDEGGTAGMICFNSDDTARILSEREMRTLMQLSNRLTDPGSDADVVTRTIETLKDNPYDFPFVVFRSIGAEGNLAAECSMALETREVQVVENLGSRVADLTTGAWEIAPHTGVILPVFQSGSNESVGTLLIGINPYRLPDEKYLGFFSLLTDQIASSLSDLHVLEMERKRAAALAELDRSKTIFFSNISHEFRTPLTLLLGPIEDVLNDPETRDANRYRMGVAYRNVLRMQKLVNTLLDFSRIEAGRMEGTFSRVDIAAFTRELASSFRSAIDKAGMELVVSDGQVKAEVYVDIDLWEQIILNLISNAFKYTREGRIGVDIEAVGSEVHVRVWDTGVGIPAEQLERIFDRFHRIESADGRSQEGTGIGLAMVKELVRLHHGTITVSSQVGVGSTFTIALPTGREHLPADKIVESTIVGLRYAESFVSEALKWLPAEGDAAVEAEINEGIIVLADDNADMREYVQRLLSHRFTVITAMDGEDAFNKVLKHHPDLVLTDVMMPKVDGFGLLERIRKTPEVHNTPVIMLSARAGEEAKIDGLQAGVDDYLIKPFSAKELLARVDANIRIARSRTEHADRLEQEVKDRTTELRELNVSLQRSNDDLQQFAHVASHDLKEPVRKIRTFSSRLRDEYGSQIPEQARVFIQKIETATARMFAMIDGVLNYSVYTNGGGLPTELLNLNEQFRFVEMDLEVAINEKEGRLDVEELPQIEGAGVLVYQLLYNLVSNSLKFAKAGVPPVIKVRGRIVEEALEQKMVEITLSDNGIGFDQEHAGRIFNTFARLHARDKYEGTGLGLALCKKIVERHHGSITASGKKEEGASFVIRLPLIQQNKSI